MKIPLNQLLVDLRLLVEAKPAIHAAYLFGSVLNSDLPNDIDLLLIYNPHMLNDARDARSELRSLIEYRCGGPSAHIMMMTSSEVSSSRILEDIQHRVIS